MALDLEADTLHHAYRGTPALAGASVRVPAGTVTALVGESGCGKTTLLRAFNRLVQPDRGSVRVGGEDVLTLDPVSLRRRLGYVPQHGGLLPHWTVRRNVELVPRLTAMADVTGAADDALEHVGLDPGRFGDRLPSELSGGQRQRAALARALAAKQEAMLLDEPFGALDAISRGEVHDAFDRVRRDFSFTALLVTHDLAEAARLADRIAVMRVGRVEQEGTVEDLQRVPASDYVRDLFERARAAHARLGSQ
ncbi:MAG TPA: ATP-binding cassette domain-containing protein [Gemmatimonadaceae bacterium]